MARNDEENHIEDASDIEHFLLPLKIHGILDWQKRSFGIQNNASIKAVQEMASPTWRQAVRIKKPRPDG
jgi:hypothetical protein